MASSNVGCSLNMYEIKIPKTQITTGPLLNSAAAGVIEVLLHQPQATSNMMSPEYIDIGIPQTRHALLRIPYEILLQRDEGELYIGNMLSSALKIDSSACEYLTPKIASFAISAAQKNGRNGFKVVAEVRLCHNNNSSEQCCFENHNVT